VSARHTLSREEQALLFHELPDHCARLALFKVNTGYCDREVCGLFVIAGDRRLS
jgi:hypothetical protein